MKLSTNFKEYMQGKAKLQNAMHVDPDDKIQNMLKQSTNHRFWANDYTSFKKGLLKDVEPAKVVLEGLKIKKKTQTILEKQYGGQVLLENIQPDGTVKFKCRLKGTDVSWNNLPQEICNKDNDEYVDECRLTIDYTARVEYNSDFIEGFTFTFDKIEANITIAGYDESIDDSTSEEYHVWMNNPMPEQHHNVLITVQNAPYYLDDISIDCHNTMDFSKWKVEQAIFGKDSDY